MPGDSASLPERATAAFAKLAESALRINNASDELSKPIASLEAAFKNLNIGVACWVPVSKGIIGDVAWKQDLGYTSVNGRWCIAIRSDDAPYDEEPPAKIWPFNEAPRYLRIKAVDKLVDLIEALVEASDASAKRLEQKVGPTRDVAAAVLAQLRTKK